MQAVLDDGWNYFDEVPTQLIDPARVLREVEAKRHILDGYESLLKERKAHPDDLAIAGALLTAYGTVCALATVYSDHPDYDPAWAWDD